MKLISKTKYEEPNLSKLNKTSRFVFPGLGLDFEFLWKNSFVNAYLCDHEYEVHYDNHLYLLFNPLKFTTKFEQFCEVLRDHESFVDEYDILEQPEGKVMMVFRYPEEYHSNVLEPFKQGAYSKFSLGYMEKHIEKYDGTGKLSLRWQIYHKHGDARKTIEDLVGEKLSKDQEVWSRPLPKDEIYRYNPEITIDWGH